MRTSDQTLSSPRARYVLVVGSMVVLLAVVAGVVWRVARTRSPQNAHAVPSAAATSTPYIVYRSDWSRGPDGWQLPAAAKVSDGQILLDGAGALTLGIPYVPKTRNYSIEMDYQILAAAVGGHFGLTARNAGGDRQYLAQMQCTPMHQGAWTPALGGCPGAVLVDTRGGTYPAGLWTSDYVVHGGPQTFRLDVTGDTVNFCLSGDCLVPVKSAVPLDASPHLLIEARAVRLLITRITVTAL
jgi:hypothetical protein